MLGRGLAEAEAGDGVVRAVEHDAGLRERGERGGAGEEGLVEVTVEQDGAVRKADGEVRERGGHGERRDGVGAGAGLDLDGAQEQGRAGFLVGGSQVPDFEQRVADGVFFLWAIKVSGFGRRVNEGRTPRVTRSPLRSAMCVTLPPVCATHTFMRSKSSLSWYTEPCMSARRVPFGVDAMHEISGVFCREDERVTR